MHERVCKPLWQHSDEAVATHGAYELCEAQVIWRLDSGAKTFLPRLQGALTAINPSPSDAACYVVTQADNTIRLVGHSLPSLHSLVSLSSSAGEQSYQACTSCITDAGDFHAFDWRHCLIK